MPESPPWQRLMPRGRASRDAITDRRGSPLDGETVQQRVEALPGRLDRYRSGRRRVVPLVHQEIAILSDFVDVITDIRRYRSALLDTGRPINKVSGTNRVVAVSRDAATVRAERRLKFVPHSDQV